MSVDGMATAALACGSLDLARRQHSTGDGERYRSPLVLMAPPSGTRPADQIATYPPFPEDCHRSRSGGPAWQWWRRPWSASISVTEMRHRHL